jgi:hypothetical protein
LKMDKKTIADFRFKSGDYNGMISSTIQANLKSGYTLDDIEIVEGEIRVVMSRTDTLVNTEGE